jgi:hypothetical protein
MGHIMTAADWFMVFSSVAFLAAGWVAFKRMLWLRWLGFNSIAFLATWYHACQASRSCQPPLWQVQADHIAGIWLATTLLLLWAHFRYQLVELFYGLLVAGGAAALVLLEQEARYEYVIPYVLGTTVPVIIISWVVRGPVEARWPWAGSGLVFGVAATVLFFIQEEVEADPILHGCFHLSAAAAGVCLCYGLRDPNIQQGYHIMKDLRGCDVVWCIGSALVPCTWPKDHTKHNHHDFVSCGST